MKLQALYVAYSGEMNFPYAHWFCSYTFVGPTTGLNMVCHLPVSTLNEKQ